ncbi:tRNA uridine-5-carboxymethylaminomethyl(34) synthesis GTPase MnmE [candidate division WOR-3 bacterium]|nr:tRNA uridine-5-carboxymethylaminomethyl(34) synthesis GTPase MnmE [candidate division WOR-3 bacterium]
MDTITAISTPPGDGGIAVVRISGEESLYIADGIFSGKSLPSDMKSHRVIHGEICDDDSTIDQVLLTVMKAPHTYTGEDMVEISCHGGTVTPSRILKAILKKGARQAKPGEFTERAFLIGRIDLIQAEAIADIISARSNRAQESAFSLLKGELSEKIVSIRDSLEEIETLIEGCINFPEDLIVDDKDIYIRITEAKEEVEGLQRGVQYGRLIKEGVSIPIVGRTNVGKSTLFNALLESERAIVTPIPGTTRDIIEGRLEIEGITVRLLDTCGIRDSNDSVEAEGMRRTMSAIENSEIVLFVIDQSCPLREDDFVFISRLKEKNVIAVMNKCDLGSKDGYKLPFRKVTISARTKENIKELLSLLRNKLSPPKEDFVIMRERQVVILERVKKYLNSALCMGGVPPTLDITADNISSALSSLQEMGGEKRKDVIESIFSQFCIGK